MTKTTTLTPAQDTAVALLTDEGGETTLDLLNNEGVRTTTVRALARRGVVTIDDGGWVDYRGEAGAPVRPVAGNGWAWRCPCGSRGSGGTRLEASDWRDHHLDTHAECRV